MSRESANKLVSHTVHGAEVYRTGWVSLKFLPELENVVVDGAGGRIMLIAPHLIEQLVAGNDAIGILHQELKRFEFLSGENHGLAVALDFYFLEVRRDAVEIDHVDAGGAGGVPEGDAHSGQEFAGTERLGDVIVGAEFEQQDFVGDVTGGAEDEYGERGSLRFDRLAHFVAGKFRQAEIEYDGGGMRRLKTFERGLSISADLDGEALGFK